jgi:hypothetical protein
MGAGYGRYVKNGMHELGRYVKNGMHDASGEQTSKCHK